MSNKIVKSNCGIYGIFNTANGKVYIGSTNNLPHRRNGHFHCLRKGKHPNRHLQLAFNKYGEQRFCFRTIQKCTEKLLLDREDAWIKRYNSMDSNDGYNIEYPDRHTLSEETRRKISESHKGKKLSEEHREKLSASQMGRRSWNEGQKLSKKHRARLSDSHKGSYPLSEIQDISGQC